MEASCEPPEEFLEASWDTWGHHESLLGASWKLLGALGCFPGNFPGTSAWPPLSKHSYLQTYNNLRSHNPAGTQIGFTQTGMKPNWVHANPREPKLNSRQTRVNPN